MKTIKNLLAAVFVFFVLAGSAHAALAIIAHPSNKVSGISADQAEDIYLGKTGVLPNGQRVTPVDQNAGSAAREKFYSEVVKKDESALRAYWSKLMFTGRAQPPREIGHDADVKRWVATNPDAIGYVDGKFVDSSVKVLLILP